MDDAGSSSPPAQARATCPEGAICCTMAPMTTGGGLPHRLEKYADNPTFRTALHPGIAPRSFALLDTTGRHSGQVGTTRVGNGLDGRVSRLVSEHGTNDAYGKNLTVKPQARITIGRSWRTGTATVLREDALARRRHIDNTNGLTGRGDGGISRDSAGSPATVRIDLHPITR